MATMIFDKAEYETIRRQFKMIDQLKHYDAWRGAWLEANPDKDQDDFDQWYRETYECSES